MPHLQSPSSCSRGQSWQCEGTDSEFRDRRLHLFFKPTFQAPSPCHQGTFRPHFQHLPTDIQCAIDTLTSQPPMKLDEISHPCATCSSALHRWSYPHVSLPAPAPPEWHRDPLQNSAARNGQTSLLDAAGMLRSGGPFGRGNKILSLQRVSGRQNAQLFPLPTDPVPAAATSCSLMPSDPPKQGRRSRVTLESLCGMCRGAV